eukprot:TRINITY_DN2003_c1_g1_i1.p1 TRINITY_DN2003_c1_g1~~TRINITY_DN2003_c1_g1_i1.p1  ORF type:complete len:809 (+),score=166.16 TRINITY_DN2003_c1_g1_i1:123-2429(+)
MFIQAALLLSLTVTVAPPLGSVVFMSAEGLHTVGTDGTGFRTVYTWDRNDNEAVKGAGFPPVVGGLCVDETNEIAFWTVNNPKPISHTVHAIDLRASTMNPTPVELVSASDEEYMGCAVDSANKRMYYFSSFPSATGVKLLGLEYTGPDAISATSTPDSPGSKIGLKREGGAVAFSGGTVYLSLRDSGGTNTVNTWGTASGASSFTKQAETNAVAWPDDVFFSHFSTEPSGEILMLLGGDGAATSESTTLYRLIPGTSLDVIWKKTMIAAPLANAHKGALQGGFAATTSPGVICLASASTWTAGTTPVTPPDTLYLTDLAAPDTPSTVYTASASMVGQLGLGPIAFLAAPLPPVMPPVEPPVEPPVAPPVATPELSPLFYLVPLQQPTDAPDTDAPDTPAPATQSPPVPVTDAPDTPAPSTPVPAVECGKMNSVECANTIECNYDLQQRMCVPVDCAARPTEASCKVLSSCVFREGTGCVLGPNCNAQDTADKCNAKAPDCKWDSAAIACALDKTAPSSDNVNGFLLFVLIGVGAVLLCAICLIILVCCLSSARRKDEKVKEIEQELTEKSAKPYVEAHRARKTCHELKKSLLEPPEIDREVIYGKKEEINSETDEEDDVVVAMVPEHDKMGGEDLGLGGEGEELFMGVTGADVVANETEAERELKNKIREAQGDLMETRKEITEAREHDILHRRRMHEESLLPSPTSYSPPDFPPSAVEDSPLTHSPKKVFVDTTPTKTHKPPPYVQERHQSLGIIKGLASINLHRE